MATEAHGEEEVDSESSTESVSESVEGSDNQDDVVQDHGNYSYNFPRNMPRGYQSIFVAKDYFVSQYWVRDIRMPPIMAVAILGIGPPEAVHTTAFPFRQAGMVPRTLRANFYF